MRDSNNDNYNIIMNEKNVWQIRGRLSNGRNFILILAFENYFKKKVKAFNNYSTIKIKIYFTKIFFYAVEASRARSTPPRTNQFCIENR